MRYTLNRPGEQPRKIDTMHVPLELTARGPGPKNTEQPGALAWTAGPFFLATLPVGTVVVSDDGRVNFTVR